MVGRNTLWFVVAVMMVVVASVRVSLAATQPSTTLNNDAARLQEIQEEFLNVFGNTIRSITHISELMTVIYSRNGQYMTNLLQEGSTLVAAREDKWTLLANFSTQIRDRLSPEVQKIVKDCGELFGGFELSTLPLIFEEAFKEEKLDSMSDMPRGQLMDQLIGMLQPIASKYGVDMNAFMKSMMGKDRNNARDLIFAALDKLNVTSLSQFFKTPLDKEVQMAETDTRPTISRDQTKKRKETLRFFRPLIATLLRENEIDLDPDAVLKVLSPLLSIEVLSQALPMLSTLGSQAGDGFVPLLSSILGGAEGQANREYISGVVSGLGALLRGEANQNVDISTMITMASMFMNSGKTSLSEEKGKSSTPSKATIPDISTLADLAGKLAEGNNVDVDAILNTASSFLVKNVQLNKLMQPSEVKDSTGRLKEETSSPKAEDYVTTSPKRPRQIADIIEPVLLAIRTDEQGNRKIKDFIVLCKNLMKKRLAILRVIIHDIKDLATRMGMPPGVIQIDALYRVNWQKLSEKLMNQDKTREGLVQTLTPIISDTIAQLTSSSNLERVYEAVKMKIKTLPYRLHELTWDTLPKRLAPMVERRTSDWKLAVKPVTLLLPLRDYVRDLVAWVSAGLAYMGDQPTRKVLERVVKVSTKKAVDRIAGVAKETMETKPPCLPLVICRLNTGLNPTTLATAVTRGASLLFATEPALEDPDPSLLLQVVTAASGQVENCEETFRNFAECKHYYIAEDEHPMDYQHEEL